MFRFRDRNNMKAGRAAEAPHGGQEEFQLEWAWKPLAAMMNENSTDQVYWTPPVYTSNLVAACASSAATTPRQGPRKKKLSSSRRRNRHMADVDITEEDDSTTQPVVTAPQQGLPRKKKLSSSRRRSKLMVNDSNMERMEEEDENTVKEDDFSTYCQDDSENNSSIFSESLVDDNEWDNQDANDSGIHEVTVEKPQEIDSFVTSHDIENGGEYDKEMSNTDKEIIMHNTLIHNSHAGLQGNVNKPRKLTSSPTLLKLVEKFSQLRCLSGMQTKNINNDVRKVASEPNRFSNKKNKRPSVKVYQRHSLPSSARSSFSARSNNKTSNQKEIIIAGKPLLSATPQCEETESGIFDQSDTENEDTSNKETVRNAQLQMMLNTLTQLYEERLTRQENEMEDLRSYVQTQDKLMMLLVHFTMDLKADFDKLKKNQELGNGFQVVNENTKETEQQDDQQISNSYPSKNTDNGQKTPISPKPNILTIRIGEN